VILQPQVANASPEQFSSFVEIYSQCREPNTIKKYETHFKVWKNWAEKFNICVVPADPNKVALFMLHLIQSEAKMPKIEACYYAIKFFHNSANLSDPCEHTLVKNMYEAAKRIKKHKVTKKKAFKLNHIQDLFKITNEEDLSEMRTFVVLLLSFCGFLRFDEASNIRRSDIHIFDSYMKIYIEKSKTDIYREGHWSFIAKGLNGICPVENVIKYCTLANISEESDEFLFRAMTTSKHNKKLRKMNKPLSYTRTREIFKDICKKLKLNSSEFGLHSLRAGGASTAANRGVSYRLFKRHGRWKSDKAKDGYIEDDISALLSVSQTLGL